MAMVGLAPKVTGTVKWFNEEKGYGFITPDKKFKGIDDLFVHKSSIYSLALRTLSGGEKVEFLIDNDNGRFKAVQVGGPNGSSVKGMSSKGGNENSKGGKAFRGECFRCNKAGHMAKDCPDKI